MVMILRLVVLATRVDFTSDRSTTASPFTPGWESGQADLKVGLYVPGQEALQRSTACACLG